MQYNRLVAYDEKTNTSFIIDAYGLNDEKFSEISEFDFEFYEDAYYTLIDKQNGFKGNIPLIETPDENNFIVRAAAKGKWEESYIEENGDYYKVIMVNGRWFIPQKIKVTRTIHVVKQALEFKGKMIKICNLRNEKPIYPYDVRVDRTNKILGNKFYMKDESQRDKVCDDYEKWFYEQINSKNQEVIVELERLYHIYKQYGQIRLFCWCYPKRCHAETIKKYLEKINLSTLS